MSTGQDGFRFGAGAVAGAIIALIAIAAVVALLVGGFTYKTPYQKWSDCVVAAVQNGTDQSVCGPQP